MFNKVISITLLSLISFGANAQGDSSPITTVRTLSPDIGQILEHFNIPLAERSSYRTSYKPLRDLEDSPAAFCDFIAEVEKEMNQKRVVIEVALYSSTKHLDNLIPKTILLNEARYQAGSLLDNRYCYIGEQPSQYYMYSQYQSRCTCDRKATQDNTPTS